MASLLALVFLLAPGGALARGDPALVRRAFARGVLAGPVVTDILFVGNESFEDDSLFPYMQTRKSGFSRKSHYDRRAFLRDLENLQRFYVSQGFLDADVGLDDMMLSADSTSVRLLIGVYEGDRWMAEDVSFEGASVIPEEKLRGVVTVREGTPFVIGELDSDRRAVLEEYARRSYLDARVAQDVARDDDNRSVTIAYRITEREQASIASIDVIGDEKTRQYVIERELTFAPGEFFDFKKIGESQVNVYRTGLFNSVWIEPAPEDTGRAEKRVVVRVAERSSGHVDFNFGYAAIDGVEVAAGIFNRNVQGQARALGLTGKYSGRVREARASIGDPWFLGRRVSAEAAARYGWSDEKSFIAETTGASFVLSKELNLRLTLEGGYKYERTVVLEEVDDSGDGDENYTGSILVAANYDSRDDILNATRGTFIRKELEFASSRLGGTNDFVRYNIGWRGYKKIVRGWVAALELRTGWVKPQGGEGEVPINERYFLGGEGSVRGFLRNSLGPIGESGKPAGGRALALARGEVRFPVYKSLHGAVFVDAGQVFADFDAMGLSELAVAGGVGLRYATRVGLLRLDVAKPMSEKGDVQFYFSVGQAF
jgi:outer membrane protein insertion porin family